MSERPARARLFVALDLPAQVREDLAAWAADVTRGRDGLRLIDADMLHVTLCFLGWREETEAEAIGAAIAECAGPAPDLVVEAAAWLPPRRPRVLAVDLQDGDGVLGALQRRVSEAMEVAAGYKPERRAFRAHVTVARVQGGSTLHPYDLDAPPSAPFRGAALTLYSSSLRRGGARYTPLARVRL